MRFSSGDVRDHILSHKIDHGSSYRSYRALQRRRPLKIDFREIFGADRFSTFATVSANRRHCVTSLDHLVRAAKQWQRNSEAECLRSLEVDN